MARPGLGVQSSSQSTIKPNTKRLVLSPLLLKTPVCSFRGFFGFVRKIFMILESLMSCKPEKEPNKKPASVMIKSVKEL